MAVVCNRPGPIGRPVHGGWETTAPFGECDDSRFSRLRVRRRGRVRRSDRPGSAGCGHPRQTGGNSVTTAWCPCRRRGTSVAARLAQRTLETAPVGDVVLKQHLVVVVGALRVGVDAVRDGEEARAVGAAKLRTETHAIDARAAVAVIRSLRDVAVENADAGRPASLRRLARQRRRSGYASENRPKARRSLPTS